MYRVVFPKDHSYFFRNLFSIDATSLTSGSLTPSNAARFFISALSMLSPMFLANC
uniref:Uncharacterized protein n=1 Tax=uncultured marine virus TaxID=186617 RepID=A0A0F7L6R3_9VIRU|nr:hypothetical protein [uncultured marine virus]